MYSPFDTRDSKAWTTLVQKETVATEKLAKSLLGKLPAGTITRRVQFPTHAPHQLSRPLRKLRKPTRTTTEGSDKVYITPANRWCSTLDEYRKAEVLENMAASELRAG